MAELGTFNVSLEMSFTDDDNTMTRQWSQVIDSLASATLLGSRTTIAGTATEEITFTSPQKIVIVVSTDARVQCSIKASGDGNYARDIAEMGSGRAFLFGDSNNIVAISIRNTSADPTEVRVYAIQ